jgi:hypothetical protein
MESFVLSSKRCDVATVLLHFARVRDRFSLRQVDFGPGGESVIRHLVSHGFQSFSSSCTKKGWSFFFLALLSQGAKFSSSGRRAAEQACGHT